MESSSAARFPASLSSRKKGRAPERQPPSSSIGVKASLKTTEAKKIISRMISGCSSCKIGQRSIRWSNNKVILLRLSIDLAKLSHALAKTKSKDADTSRLASLVEAVSLCIDLCPSNLALEDLGQLLPSLQLLDRC